ncbi:MAG: hypothetical protein E6155_24255, partial [Klebsiella pneumoniae]|nr:hypothetical protein [Klebsiella pneumoniae]
DVFAGKKSAQIREILISESAWEEMTCLFAPSLACLPNYSIYGITDEVHFIFNIVIPVSFIIMIGNCI